MSTPEQGTHSFAELLTTFAQAVQANHGRRLALLFTEDGVYEDGFFGANSGQLPFRGSRLIAWACEKVWHRHSDRPADKGNPS